MPPKLPNRTIFHCDCDSFFASVEETFNPGLRNSPMAVAGDPRARHGIILAKNQKAKVLGIKTAETIWQAKQKCKDLVLVPPSHGKYSEFCEKLNQIYEDYTDQVERFSIDESYLDVTGSLHFYKNDPVELAKIIQARVKDELDITISIGISWNKVFAKLGSDQNKPNGLFVITRENFRETVWPLNVAELIYIGRKTVEALKRLSVYTIGDLAEIDKSILLQMFGKRGEDMHIYANGLDTEPVGPVENKRQVKSVGNGATFKRDLTSLEDIHTGVLALADTVAGRLRKKQLKASTIQVSIKDSFFNTIQKQKTLNSPTYLASDIAIASLEIIEACWQIGKPIRLITITTGCLSPADESGEQLSLFEPSYTDPKTETIELAMDKIRERFGKDSIMPSVFVKNDLLD
jgi:DNA polymerase-4